MPSPPTCLNCGAPLDPAAASRGALECGRCPPPPPREGQPHPGGRPPVLAGARRVNVTIDGETDRRVKERAERDGVSWAEALRRIVTRRGEP